ncbi:MAG: GTA-gp10 family protein [Advenella sp.]
MKRKLTIEFGGESYEVSPNFDVIERIEQRFDLYSFMRSISTMQSRTRDIAWVIFCALSEAGEDVMYKDIGEIVLQDIGQATNAAAEIVSSAISGGPEKLPKKKSTNTQNEKVDGGE